MLVQNFYKNVRILTDTNEQDFPDSEIAVFGQMEIDKLYEMAIEGYAYEQTKNQQPTVYTLNVTDNFVETEDNLWIERVEFSRNGKDYYTLQKTNKQDYEAMGCSCDSGSLTNDLESKTCANYYIQTSQGVHVFPIGDGSGIVKIYVKDHPVIDWNNNNYNILIPNISDTIIVTGTALMYRNIHNTNEYDRLYNVYQSFLKLFEKRIKRGKRMTKFKLSDKRNLL